MTKNQLRSYYKEVRRKFWNALSIAEQSHIADELAAQTLNYLSSLHLSDKSIGLYYATPEETPTLSLINLLHQKSYMLSLPKISQDTGMDFFLYNPGENLKANDFGILEPVVENLQTPQVLIMPGIAFTEQGHRVGYGKGYYDRYLEKQREQGHNPHKIGYSLDCQIAPTIPTDPHDQIMDCVVTQTRVSLVRPKT